MWWRTFVFILKTNSNEIIFSKLIKSGQNAANETNSKEHKISTRSPSIQTLTILEEKH